MPRNVRNTLRQRLEAADLSNDLETRRLVEHYERALAEPPTTEIELRAVETHLRTLLDQVRVVRPRLAGDIEATVGLLLRLTAHNGHALSSQIRIE